MSLGPSEIIVVLLIALVVLGPDKLPGAARTFGKYMAEFRKFSAAVQSQVDEALKAPDMTASTKEEPQTEADKREAEEKPDNPDTSGFELIDEKRPPKAEGESQA